MPINTLLEVLAAMDSMDSSMLWDASFMCDIFIVLEAVDKLLLVEIKKSMFVTLFGDPP